MKYIKKNCSAIFNEVADYFDIESSQYVSTAGVKTKDNLEILRKEVVFANDILLQKQYGNLNKMIIAIKQRISAPNGLYEGFSLIIFYLILVT